MSYIPVPKTLAQISAWPHRCGGVGSRDTPGDVLTVMEDLGCALCTAGYLIGSGDADGADDAFHKGARRSPRYGEVGFAAYIPYNGMRVDRAPGRVYEDLHDGIYNASLFQNWEEAGKLAFEARGSFEGLKSGGIALHTRNPYQVLSPDLQHPAERLILWAKPVGKQGNVKGGTNTAVKIAQRFNVPIVNLYYEEKLEQVLAFIKRINETRQ